MARIQPLMCFALLWAASNALAQPVALSSADKRSLLSRMNEQRSQTAAGQSPGPGASLQPAAANMGKLLWDPGLASVASAYAARCVWQHNPNRSTDIQSYSQSARFNTTGVYVGENLAATSASPSTSALLGLNDLWFDESANYSFSSDSCSGVCGHYTQAVWADTRYVGCGAHFCPTIQGLSFGGTLFVCNYYRGGNIIGSKPYVSGAACSACGGDSTGCANSLCTGCPAADPFACAELPEDPPVAVAALPSGYNAWLAMLLAGLGVCCLRRRRGAA